MKRLFLVLLAGLLGLGLLAGCAPASATDLMKDITPAQTPDEPAPAPVPAAYTDAMAAFGWSLLRASAGNAGSLLVSPPSVHLALTMALNGADTETRAQMLALLAGEGLSLDGLNAAARAALARWNDATVEERLSIANSIWFDQSFTPDPAFLQTNADHFTAAARRIDFRTADALEAINGWVKEATRGVIPTIVDQIPADAVMYLINAIHFKADWAVPFTTDDTVKRVFRAPSGDVEADFMNRTGPMQYLDGDDMSGILLPYKGGRFGFFAILPGEGLSPRDLIGKYTDAQLQDFLAVLLTNKANFTVTLALPKFKNEYKDSLKNELAGMGMDFAFDAGRADFSLMNESRLKNLFIGDVLHKTFIRVDEKGTEAAAVTAVEIRLTSLPVPGVPMTFDRPFLYGIVDLESSLPMFVGILESPAE